MWQFFSIYEIIYFLGNSVEFKGGKLLDSCYMIESYKVYLKLAEMLL